ncbi:MAG: ATP-binding protein [Minisyncoccia bacterium]
MDFNFPQNIQYCKDIVNAVSSILYYSSIPSAVISLLIGIFVLFKSKFSLLGKILFSISISFSAWVTSSLLIWIFYFNNSVVMSAWAPIEIFSILLYILCLYFVYVYIEKRDINIWTKLLVSSPLFLIIFLVPTTYNISEYDIQECVSVENPAYTNFILGLKIFFSLWIISYSIYKYIKANKEFRKQILLLMIGMIIFLLSFLVAGYVAEQTYVYIYEAAGLFGMVVFLAFLAYLIVRFKAFDIKLIATQALVVALVILIGSQFFFIQTNINRILTAVTLIITGVIGINLIRSVKKENELNESLQIANEGQSNLIHIMNHQIKGYLSKSRNIFAELLSENGYGINDESRPMIKEGFESLTEGVGFVQQVLNGSSAETGALIYAKNRFDMKELVEDTVKGQKDAAEKVNLSLELKIDDGDYKMLGDNVQIKECVRNLIDNSIRYTQKGGLKVHLAHNRDKIVFSVEDTGVGIAPEDRPKLFTKGGRGKDSLRININSTGYGLAFVKAVVEAHKGRVWVDSKGTNQGSTFYMELPVVI